ncbi:AAA family ATPase, partial [Streptomyces sp. NPDC060210]|uniref:AAA family ATPase n=1 Tax=Streptomyces sp. NPDC060210 TaxID=3347074 RepID=UPI00365CD2EA
MDEQAGDPGAAGGPEPDTGELIVGRDAELARLFRAVDAVSAAGPGWTAGSGPAADSGPAAGSVSAEPVLVLVGEVGTGKSTLLGSAALRAEARGARVLRADGSESESSLAFSTLHQLLRPVRATVDGLPERQRTAVHDAFGVGPATAAPDLMLIGVAVLSLLSALGDESPVLVVLDDAQWCDRASLDALAFAARRLRGERVTLLIGARVGDPLPGFDRHVPTLVLGPLDDTAAGRLLDRRPRPPSGRTRTQILDQAGGNPLALAELARAATAHGASATPPTANLSSTGPSSTRLPSADPSSVDLPTAGLPTAGPLPLTDRLERIFAARLDDLPASTTRALLLLAAMDGVDSAIAAPTGPPHADDDAWPPAERAGLVRRTGRGVRFRHPLVRSAVYHAAPFDARRAAHLALAGMLRDEPDRRAWHLAAASSRPDAAVSAELERTAGRARRRGGYAAAAKALQRAAELAPRREDSARLLVEAAATAVFTGDIGWVEELAAAARARTDDASLLASAAVQTGRLAALTVRHTVVFSRLADAAERLTVSRPADALDLLATAAVVRYYSGEERQRNRVRALLRRLPDDASDAWLRTWVRAVSDPFDGRAELVSLLPRLAAEAERRPDRLITLAIMAWLLDETPCAVRAVDEAVGRWEPRGPLPEGLGGAVAWAFVEQGRWDQAREFCARTTAVGSTAGLDHAVACAASADATVLA